MSNTNNQPDSQAGHDIETILLNRVAIIGDSQATYKGTPAELAKELADYAERRATERAVAELQRLRDSGYWSEIQGATREIRGFTDEVDYRIKELTATLTKEAK